MGAANNSAIGVVDTPIAVRIPEFDAAEARTVLARNAATTIRDCSAVTCRQVCGNIGSTVEVAIKLLTEERANRVANHVDNDVVRAQRVRPEEIVLNSVDRNDLVLVVTAVKRDVPPRSRVTNGEVKALVLHLTDVDDRRARDTGCPRGFRGGEQDVWGGACDHVHDVEDGGEH